MNTNSKEESISIGLIGELLVSFLLLDLDPIHLDLRSIVVRHITK